MNSKKTFLIISMSLLTLMLLSTGVFSESFDEFDESTSCCTTVLVGKDASVDGCPMVAYSCDGYRYDMRVIPVPRKDHKPGEMRPVYGKPPGNIRYPRIVNAERAPGYASVCSQPPTEPLAYIPEVEHTYSYFEQVMPILNEHQLGMGECTCGVRINKTGGNRSDAPFENRSLARVAMERCTTAREAIKLMGDLAVKYGYNDWGETITIIDTEEAWVFDVVSHPNGKSAVWCAERIPDDEIAAFANRFTIREIDLDNPDYFMASDNIFKVAEEQGWWDPATPFDFAVAYNAPKKEVPYGTFRRIWRVYDILAPSRGFSPWVEDANTKEYPFSIKPDKKVSVKDLMAIFRDRLEGTEFDLSKGLAAGPFGCPNRYSGGEGEKVVKGSWERPLSKNVASHSVVIQARRWLPDTIGGIAWFGHHTAYSTCYIPFYGGVNTLPKPYMTGSQAEFSMDSSWWVFDFVSNWADLKYCYMKEDIKAAQERLESREFAMQPAIEKAACALYEIHPDLAREYLTDYCVKNGNTVFEEWWKLAFYLITKYNDGTVNKPKLGQGVGYPAWWLKEVGYGPIQKP